ncbi:UDP-GalNAc:beta-1,3-N-acetylgalactosaminyltransferase 1-like [Dendronephthya gigantea]|uniref:UDP-GalNAc:beta-1, 3-N-acetylgalactosaminyltransferase 1-like n=1 Tax=Dendronephthya gigantea TaxID=151771 RepID=UPI0010691746|nr:UDP-GalNAc:beta-1,3-N-acetylgalactosaminyltransferase 1-like [Dendronephthya gigantea]
MVNDYYPFVDFKLTTPRISPTVGATKNVFMIVLVMSGADGNKFRKRREAIRQTWGNQSTCEQRKASQDERLKHLRWLLVFVVGKAGTGTNDDILNIAEARQHNDMLIGNITDNYINLILKVYMSLLWASKFDVKYTLKADDDVYVRIPRVLEYLVNAKFPRPFYGGLVCPRNKAKVARRIGVKWTISYKYYGETHFPDFNRGPFYILSSDLFDKLFNYVSVRKPFHLEDVYVALAMHDSNIKATNIDSFQLSQVMHSYVLEENIQRCEMLSWIGFGHLMDQRAIKKLHLLLQSHVCKKITLDIDYHRCNKTG